MQITASDQTISEISADWLVLPVFESEPSPLEQAFDAAAGNVIQRLRELGDVTGEQGEIVELRQVAGMKTPRVLLVGLGKAGALTRAKLERICMTVFRRLSSKKNRSVAFTVPDVANVSAAQVAEIVATAAVVASSGQSVYKKKADRFSFDELSLATAGSDEATQQAIERGRILGESINLTRELVNRHPGEVTPKYFADRASELAAKLHIQGEVMDRHQLAQERMGALLAVSRGSTEEPRMVVLRYEGAGESAPWLALVGKGVTFDSGGLSLKPSDSMKSMKADMAGAATVLGAVNAIARLKLKVNIIAAMGLVENMVSGSSYKLGEVLTARNGTTIEIHNTDAEGRLVLADVLSYVVDAGVSQIIDLATLTGSCVVALGEEVTGVFTNNQPFCDQFSTAARAAGEDIWQLPMFDSFRDQLKSDVADIKNVGTRWGGAITAAKFLEEFVADTPWIHLDIAGPAFAESTKPHREGGGTGAMLRTLVALVESL
ncbi:MAG: leucyl aminopeptidase [Planctomycetaceae bacterium]|nr:leucyl aminopeptidase [Planctomycetaceae bacterium]